MNIEQRMGQQYNTIHQYVLRHYAKTGVCEHCGDTKKTQWANKTGNYDKYDRDDWLELCYPCHGTFDGNEPQKIGRLGGLKSRGGGFSVCPELARSAGRKGGLISKRGKIKA